MSEIETEVVETEAEVIEEVKEPEEIKVVEPVEPEAKTTTFDTPFVISDPLQNETVKSLLEKVTWLIQSIAKNTIIPITDNLLFSNGVIYSTNLMDTQMVLTDIKGTFLINAKDLQKILKQLDKTDTISFSDNKNIAGLNLLINGEEAFSFCVEHPSEFPKTAKCNNVIGMIDGADDFETLTMIEKYTSKDELRPAMTTVKLSGKCLVATNGHWLVIKEAKAITLEKESILVPNRIIKVVKKFEKGIIKTNDTNGLITIKESDRAVMFTVVDEKFPDYESVIPTSNNVHVAVLKKSLIKQINLALLAANGTTSMGIFRITNGEQVLKISAEDLDFQKSYGAEIPALGLLWEPPTLYRYHKDEVDKETGEITKEAWTEAYPGDEPATGQVFEIGVNLKFLLTIIKDVEGDLISFDMSAPNKAILLNKEFLVMPVMIAPAT